MLVRATDKYEKLNLKDKKLDRIPKQGEQFDVTADRFDVLNGNNKFNAIFVERVEIAKESNKIKMATRKINKIKREKNGI